MTDDVLLIGVAFLEFSDFLKIVNVLIGNAVCPRRFYKRSLHLTTKLPLALGQECILPLFIARMPVSFRKRPRAFCDENLNTERKEINFSSILQSIFT